MTSGVTGETTGGKRGKAVKARAVVAWIAVLFVVGGIVGATSLDGTGGDHEQTNADSGFVQERSPEAGIARSGDFDTGGGGAQAGLGVGGSSDDGGDEASVVDAVGNLSPEELGGERISIESGHVVKEASVDIDLGDDGDLAAAQEKALSTVRSAGGFVESSRVSDGTATMTFRVPVDDFEDVLRRLRDLGDVKAEDVTGDDVSAEVVDLGARLRHWHAQETAFLALMERATSISETIEIRRELGTIQQQIEQIEARMRFLDDRTAFSTLTVSLVAPLAGVTPADDGASTLEEAWDHAWDAAMSVVGGTLVVLGVLIPLSVIAGIPGLILWTVLRRRRTGTSGTTPAAVA